MPELSQASGSLNVHSRISDLRKLGHEIQQRQIREGRMVHSLYKIQS